MPINGNIRTGDWVAEIELSLDTVQYASGDLMAQAVEIEDAVKENGVTEVKSVIVIDYDDQGATFDLLFFSENPGSLGALNAALAIGDGAAGQCCGFITIDSWLDLGAQQIGQESGGSSMLRPTDGGTSIWIAARSAGTGTYATAKLTVKVGLARG